VPFLSLGNGISEAWKCRLFFQLIVIRRKKEEMRSELQKYVKRIDDVGQKVAQSRLCVHTTVSFCAKNLRM
jgi:hypothetical protein